MPALGNTTCAVDARATRRSGAEGQRLRIALVERTDAILRIVTVGFRQQSGWLARPCWSTVMSTTHGSSAVRPFGDELSFTVAQPPAKAVLAHASATTAAMMMTSARTTSSSLDAAVDTPARRRRFPGRRLQSATLARRVSHP